LLCDDADVKEGGHRRPQMRPGYNVWFGLQHVTAAGFRHSGRREKCAKCNPELVSPPPVPEEHVDGGG
jgi:hypothetical protein